MNNGVKKVIAEWSQNARKFGFRAVIAAGMAASFPVVPLHAGQNGLDGKFSDYHLHLPDTRDGGKSKVDIVSDGMLQCFPNTSRSWDWNITNGDAAVVGYDPVQLTAWGRTQHGKPDIEIRFSGTKLGITYPLPHNWVEGNAHINISDVANQINKDVQAECARRAGNPSTSTVAGWSPRP